MNSNPTYTLQDYFDAIRRRRRTFLSVALPILLAAAVLALLLEDEYTASARIDIDLIGSTVQALEPIQLTTYADQYIEKLGDRAMAPEHLAALANLPDLFPTDHELTENQRVSLVRQSVFVETVTQPVKTPGGRDADLITGFAVRVTSADPQFAHRVADYLSKRFIEADRNSRAEQASTATTFLREQMNRTEREIVELEQQVAEFKVANACCLQELMDLNLSVIQRTERDIEDLQPRIRILEKDRAFKQSQIDELKLQSTSTSRLAELEAEYLRLVANYGPEHPDVIRVRREITAITGAAEVKGGEAYALVELRIRLADAEQRYSDEHPDVIRYRREIAALEAKQGSASNIGAEQAMLLDNPRYLQLRAELNDIDTELSELRRRVPELRQKIGDYEDRMTRTPQIEGNFQALSRKLETARDNFENLQNQLVGASQTEALESTEISARLTEVRPSSLPDSPSGPPRIAIMVIAIFLAGSFGVGAMLVAEMTDSTVRGRKDVELIMEVVPLASIPIIENTVGRARYWQFFLLSGIMLAIVVAVILLY